MKEYLIELEGEVIEEVFLDQLESMKMMLIEVHESGLPYVKKYDDYERVLNAFNVILEYCEELGM